MGDRQQSSSCQSLQGLTNRAHRMDDYPKSFGFMSPFMSLWSLNHLLAFVHRFISVSAFHPDSLIDRRAGESCVCPEAKQREHCCNWNLSVRTVFHLQPVVELLEGFSWAMCRGPEAILFLTAIGLVVSYESY